MSDAVPSPRTFVVLIPASLLALLLVATMAMPVRATTITVTTTADELNGDGDCSLREAIVAANNNAAWDACPAGQADADDVISVPAGTYTLTIVNADLIPEEDAAGTGDLDITESVQIVGAGAGSTIIDGGGIDRVFHLVGEDADITGVTIQGGVRTSTAGYINDVGGGIFAENGADLDLIDSVVTDNDAGTGGGIYLEDDGATLELSGTTVSDNEATPDGGGFGGGIAADDDAEEISAVDSTVSGNTAAADGGGIWLDNGVAVLIADGLTVSGNTATLGAGGGIWSGSGTDVSLLNSIVDDNVAGVVGDVPLELGEGGGIAGWDAVTLENTVVSDNSAAVDGGGIWMNDNLDLLNSTVSGNVAGDEGGGIYNIDDTDIEYSTISGNTAGTDGGGIWSPDLFLFNSTVSGNDAGDRGGGVFADGSLSTEFVTIASNQANAEIEAEGGGIWTEGDATFWATIVANNSPGGDCFHNDTSVESFGSNLDTDDTCDFDATSDLPDADPNLGPLAANDAPTMTHALLAGSEAIDAVQIISEFDYCAEFDQRGVARPIDGDENGTAECDIGAYEASPVPPAQCSDDIDNDTDGKIDFPADPGCESEADNSESPDPAAPPQCSDQLDNDADGKTDFPADPGCSSLTDDSESPDPALAPQCSDGVDNDADGKTDFPADPGCSSVTDDSESPDPAPPPQCSDQLDNDADGKTDFPADPGCSSLADNSESPDLTPTPSQQVLADTTVAPPRTSDAWIGFAMAVLLLTGVAISAVRLTRRGRIGDRR